LSKLLYAAPFEFSHGEPWANYSCFIRAVMPEAERCGVSTGLHIVTGGADFTRSRTA
jgi:D-mannonate dehydratase